MHSALIQLPERLSFLSQLPPTSLHFSLFFYLPSSPLSSSFLLLLPFFFLFLLLLQAWFGTVWKYWSWRGRVMRRSPSSTGTLSPPSLPPALLGLFFFKTLHSFLPGFPIFLENKFLILFWKFLKKFRSDLKFVFEKLHRICGAFFQLFSKLKMNYD